MHSFTHLFSEFNKYPNAHTSQVSLSVQVTQFEGQAKHYLIPSVFSQNFSPQLSTHAPFVCKAYPSLHSVHKGSSEHISQFSIASVQLPHYKISLSLLT